MSRCSRLWTEQPALIPRRGCNFHIDVFAWPFDSLSLTEVPPLLDIHWLKSHCGLFAFIDTVLHVGLRGRCLLQHAWKKKIWSDEPVAVLYPSGFICQWSHAIMSLSNHASNAGISECWVGALSAHQRGWKDSSSPAFVGFGEFWQLYYTTWWVTCILRGIIWLKWSTFDLIMSVKTPIYFKRSSFLA